MISKSTYKKIRDFARKYHKDADYNHDIEHVDRTVKLAELIAKKEKANVDVCKVAAYLHDIGRKFNKDVHGNIGAKIAEKFLKKLIKDKKFIKQICHAISCHDEATINKAKTKEAKVVYDADKLQIMGPFGFCRLLSHHIYAKKMPLKKSLSATKKMNTKQYSLLKTKTAKKMIKDEFNLMLNFFKIYDKWDKVKL